MAGHSHFRNIVARKSTMDKKKQDTITKFCDRIANAAKAAKDSNMKVTLHQTIELAKKHNVPLEAIKRALHRHNQEEKKEYGCGIGEINFIIQGKGDFLSNLKKILKKYGGKIFSTKHVFNIVGEVSWQSSKILQTNTILEMLRQHKINVIKYTATNNSNTIILPLQQLHKSVVLIPKIASPTSHTIYYPRYKIIPKDKDVINAATKEIHNIPNIDKVYSNLQYS